MVRRSAHRRRRARAPAPRALPPRLPRLYHGSASRILLSTRTESMNRKVRGSVMDLLAELTILHSYIEKELEGVALAINDLFEDHQAAATSARLQLSKNRILAALARQRVLLWEFSTESEPTAGFAHSEDNEGVHVGSRHQNPLHEPAVGSIADKQCTACGPDGNSNSVLSGQLAERKLSEELQWKRDTLVRMKHLLRRKAGDPGATEAERGAIRRDIDKVDAALQGLQDCQQGGFLPQVATIENHDALGAPQPLKKETTQEQDTSSSNNVRCYPKSVLREVELRLPE